MILFIASAALFIFMGYGLFTLSRKRTPQQFPVAWEEILSNEVLFYQKLSAKKQAFFKKRMMAFLAEVNVEAVQFEITDRDKIFVAASAVIPIFNFGDWHYNNLDTVLIYPDYFNADLEFHSEGEGRNIGGMVGSGQFENHMILSRKALVFGFANKTDKGNTAVHEFVHLLDKMDGETDGIPEFLLGKENIAPWLDLMYKEMDAINNDKSDIRKYGGTSEIEFFAVASEYFFERPELFKRKHPELYKMLELCFVTGVSA
ncbi:zinc-dependent peptidase [uncultured Dokdonia sp.]|uniref:M90 family metallopeptidase n=1 Tax=Dokdonia sp. R78006 TaxID=3093866 RepID=UPI002626EA07|nr:M90 family metallopeptidase [uncultured Dokdonia sp.]